MNPSCFNLNINAIGNFLLTISRVLSLSSDGKSDKN